MDKLKRRDFILLAAFGILAVAGLLWFLLAYRTGGAFVEVTVDGERFGVYPLGEDMEIPIDSGTGRNLLVISDGKADMVEASCPDKLCVRQAAISEAGETIVCLPNKVVVTVLEEDPAP